MKIYTTVASMIAILSMMNLSKHVISLADAEPTSGYVYQRWVKIIRVWNPVHRDWEDRRWPSQQKHQGKELFLLSTVQSKTMDVAIVKWWHPKDKDWVTIPASGAGTILPALLKKWGYKYPTLLGYGSSRPFQNSVTVYRWWHPKDRDWVTIPSSGAGHIPDSVLQAWGYLSKHFIAYAHPIVEQ